MAEGCEWQYHIAYELAQRCKNPDMNQILDLIEELKSPRLTSGKFKEWNVFLCTFSQTTYWQQQIIIA